MADRSRRGLGRYMALRCCLVWAVALAAGACSGGDATTRPSTTTGSSPLVVPLNLRVLQLNLCDSGVADCYSGRSVAQAATVIRTERPDIVTLNEVCGADVSALERDLSAADPEGVVVTAFVAARDRRTGKAINCRNGQPYGDGLLVRVRPPDRGHATHTAMYAIQDVADPEARVWLCVHAITRFYACTTHLAVITAPVALRQCRYLLGTGIPALRRHDRSSDPVVLGADLNLTSGATPDVRSCVPAGYVRADDGSRQHVVASAAFRVTSRRLIDMHRTTDHPGLLVDLSSR